MKDFFVRLGNTSIYKQMFKEPMTYVTGATLLAIFAIAHYALFGSGWGVTSTFANWGAWVYQAIGGHPEEWSYFASEKSQKALAGGFLADGGSIRNLGIIFGALLSTLLASQFKIKKIKSKRQIGGALLGGFLMGYGARLANGCNIGALFTATAAMSLSGWIFGLFLLLGGFIGGKLLVHYFMH